MLTQPAIDRLPVALLEDWLRDAYFDASIDISSSGVENYTFGELCSLTGISDELNDIRFNDSRTRGSDRLRSALGRYLGCTEARIFATHGSSEAIAAVMLSLLHSGDEVVVQWPAYHSLTGFAEALNCSVRRWTLQFESSFEPDVDQLVGLMSLGPRMVVLNSPHNPTGAVLGERALQAIIAAAEASGSWLLLDQALAGLDRESSTARSLLLDYPRSVVFGTLSKVFGLAGLRVGWAVAPTDVIAQCVRFRDYTTIASSPLIETLAAAVVDNAERFISPREARLTTNRQMLTMRMETASKVLDWVPPRGGTVCFPRVRGMDDTYGLCESLQREDGVLVVPGVCFSSPQHIRIGFGGPTAELELGLDCLVRRLTEYATERSSDVC